MNIEDVERWYMGIMVSPILRDCGDRLMAFRCPGCNAIHMVYCNQAEPIPGMTWTWNDNPDQPTFTPSINVHADRDDLRCHSFVRDGQIQFLGDSHHALKNQTVPLPPYYPEGWTRPGLTP